MSGASFMCFGARMCCLGAPANRVIFVNEWPCAGWYWEAADFGRAQLESC
jgi:hypothetical protein